jgi:hypothetical protein
MIQYHQYSPNLQHTPTKWSGPIPHIYKCPQTCSSPNAYIQHKRNSIPDLDWNDLDKQGFQIKKETGSQLQSKQKHGKYGTPAIRVWPLLTTIMEES